MEGVLAIAEAIKVNVMLETIDLKDNASFGLRSRIMETIYLWSNGYISYGHLTFEIAETLKENHSRKEKIIASSFVRLLPRVKKGPLRVDANDANFEVRLRIMRKLRTSICFLGDFAPRLNGPLRIESKVANVQDYLRIRCEFLKILFVITLLVV